MIKTIAGIATPPGNSGIGIVRISGAHAAEIAQGMFKPTNLQPRVATLGTVHGEGFSDTAIAILFKAPHSFTGEDTVEFQCHGGYFLLEKVLAAAIKHGCQAAAAGEFSRQAFLNGKLSLDQAEAIIDIINSESDIQLQYASKLHQGTLKQRLFEIEQQLVSVTAEIEATLDYPEHDIEFITAKQIRPKLAAIIGDINLLIASSREGKMVSNGIRVAVLGKPNVGKSSVFNTLLQSERSIVTEIAGTTTDTITEAIHYNGIKIVFADTAGIRDGKNKIEKIGIERSRKIILESDICLAIFDASSEPDLEDTGILELVKSKPCIYVLNKKDLLSNTKNIDSWGKFIKDEIILTSALHNENIDEIKKQIFKKTLGAVKSKSSSDIIITNMRHLNELQESFKALQTALGAVEDTTLDCVASDIQTALAHLGTITGTHASEAVLDEIFSKFCLGK